MHNIRRKALIDPDFRKILEPFSKFGFPNACIAGGAIRDFDNRVPIKDIDIFIWNFGLSYDQLKEDISKFCLILTEHAPFAEGSNSYDIHFKHDLFAVFDVRIKDYFTDIPIQIIVMNEECNLESIVKKFDFGLCMCSFDGKFWHFPPEYIFDARNKVFTFHGEDKSQDQFNHSNLRYERLKQKYPDFKLDMNPKKFNFYNQLDDSIPF